MFSNSPVRLAIGLPVAAVVTFGLFKSMLALISQPYVTPEVTPTRVIAQFTPMEQPEGPIRPDKTVKPIEVVEPPKVEFDNSISQRDIDLPRPTIDNPAPAEIDRTEIPIALGPAIAIAGDAKPIRPLSIVYPERAERLGLEGDCEVKFSVDVRGRPYDVDAVCSHQVFKREAIKSVKKAEFIPRVVRGQAVEQHNVIYPLEFSLRD